MKWYVEKYDKLKNAKPIISVCGDDCAVCPRFLAETEEELHETAEFWFKAGWRDHVVTNEEIRCTGCGCRPNCSFMLLPCTKEHKVTKCRECGEFPCDKVKKTLSGSREKMAKCQAACESEKEFELFKRTFYEKEKFFFCGEKQNGIQFVALPCLCVDVFDGTDEIRPGGEALNFAVHASAFDKIDVTLLGAVGNDDYAKCIMDSIADKRINTKHLRIEPNKRTANNRTYLTEEGDRYYKEDSWDGEIVDKMLLNEKEMRVLADADAVFVHFGAGCFKQIVEAKQKYNFKLAVDFDTYRDFKDMERYAPDIDYFMISGEESLLYYFEEFSKKYDGLFNMTLAENGSVTYYKGECYRVSACGVDSVIDTTGCGDSYHAGFVCSHLINGDILMAMNKGAEIASETLGHYGGF